MANRAAWNSLPDEIIQVWFNHAIVWSLLAELATLSTKQGPLFAVWPADSFCVTAILRMQVLGLHLDAEGWAAARSTCKGWKNIQSGVKLLEIDLERDAHRCRSRL
jgi:hypothetical protein